MSFKPGWISVAVAIGLATSAAAAPKPRGKPPSLTPDAINRAGFAATPAKPDKRTSPEIVKAEVLLDRARFSPGAIDGLDGDNFRQALTAFQKQSGLPATGRLDRPTWDKLTADTAPVVVPYTITLDDEKGPFIEKMPTKFEDLSTLKRLGYVDITEELAEKFHLSESLLKALNPKTPFRAGAVIDTVAVGAPKPGEKVARIVVDKPDHHVEAFGPDGKLLAFYPASIGSEEKPAPTGQFEIRRIVRNPDYTYSPKYHFKGVTADKPFTIAAGPNNPVGAVWMDLSYEGYGIHGTPEPEAIGKTESHGCVRLTNWDALALASAVDKGVPVLFEDKAEDGSPPPAPAPVDANASAAKAPQPAPSK